MATSRPAAPTAPRRRVTENKHSVDSSTSVECLCSMTPAEDDEEGEEESQRRLNG